MLKSMVSSFCDEMAYRKKPENWTNYYGETRSLSFSRKLNTLYNGRTAILRRYVMDIYKKIWNTTVTVGQIITSAIIALTIGVVLWLLVQIFRPNKN